MKKKIYAVRKGRRPGSYDTWSEKSDADGPGRAVRESRGDHQWQQRSPGTSITNCKYKEALVYEEKDLRSKKWKSDRYF